MEFYNEIFDEHDLIEHFKKHSLSQSYLLQKAETNHETISSLSKGGLITFRVITISAKENKAEIMAAYAGMPLGIMIANHAVYGIASRIDEHTGVLGAAYSIKPRADNISIHPDTKETIKGFHLSRWPELKTLVIKAHNCFPNTFSIGWDLVFTPQGPQILEGNTQRGSRSGFFIGTMNYAKPYTQFLSEHPVNG